MKGSEIDAYVEREAGQLGIVPMHWPDSRRVTRRGWPDWVLIGRDGVIFREVKGDGDSLTSEQRAMGYRLQALGHDWAVWTSADVGPGNTIETDLGYIA